MWEMATLTQDQKEQFWRDGVLMVEDAVTLEELENLRTVFAGWVEESRRHNDDFGNTLDGRARFDLEPGHSADSPRLRRLSSPVDHDPAYWELASDSVIVDVAADLVGPDVKYHHSKLNFKLEFDV